MLELLAEDGAILVTAPGFTRSEQSAARRAAYRLEAAGRLVLRSEVVEGRARLVAYRPGGEVPAGRVVMGRDGKVYRRPAEG